MNRSTYDVKTIIKILIANFFMFVPAVIGILFYNVGFLADVAIIITAPLFAFSGYILTKKLPELIYLYIVLIFSSCSGSALSITLYYLNISSDDGTILIGVFLTLFVLAVVAEIVVAFTIPRVIKTKTSSKEAIDAL